MSLQGLWTIVRQFLNIFDSFRHVVMILFFCAAQRFVTSLVIGPSMVTFMGSCSWKLITDMYPFRASLSLSLSLSLSSDSLGEAEPTKALSVHRVPLRCQWPSRWHASHMEAPPPHPVPCTSLWTLQKNSRTLWWCLSQKAMKRRWGQCECLTPPVTPW